MSNTLLLFAKSYLKGRLTEENFVDAYIELWRIERDSEESICDEKHIDEVLSSIFIACDNYDPDPNTRHPDEYDSSQLKLAIKKIMKEFSV